ncbi:hypothetical protein CLAFUW4_11871 [Fulvia fulva]|nr:hypothetical protein CLAFUR4_11876 [Fulvia fulva]WPV18190.1 hypothetical protein CLAFUW4_11871 [Fulvia fulva]WPV33632.1 hypothetical protein CLAFUW7_11878 [Fulvia fulva]
MLGLKHRLEALPQELYDMIHDHTFTILPTYQLIAATYKPPSILQVNRSIRTGLLPTYYSTTTFEFISPGIYEKWWSRQESQVSDLFANHRPDSINGTLCRIDTTDVEELSSGVNILLDQMFCQWFDMPFIMPEVEFVDEMRVRLDLQQLWHLKAYRLYCLGQRHGDTGTLQRPSRSRYWRFKLTRCWKKMANVLRGKKV